jgi:hypothetical protein
LPVRELLKIAQVSEKASLANRTDPAGKTADAVHGRICSQALKERMSAQI